MDSIGLGSSSEALHDLAFTRYVNDEGAAAVPAQEVVNASSFPLYTEVSVECARALGDVEMRGELSYLIEDILLSRDDVVLTERGDNSMGIPARPPPPEASQFARDKKLAQNNLDEAKRVLAKIKKASKEELTAWPRPTTTTFFWLHSCRDSELALAEYLLENVDKRPKMFFFQCKNLTAEDIGHLIVKSVTNDVVLPNHHSLMRMYVAINISFGQLTEFLDDCKQDNPDLEVSHVHVNATLHDHRNKAQKSVFTTTQYAEYADLEPVLESPIHFMTALASVTISLRSRPQVSTTLTHSNGILNEKGDRIKKIEFDHSVKSKGRGVQFNEEANESHVFEIPENSRMLPLKMGVPQVGDLIDYLSGFTIGETHL